jgi:hypothetical protein
MQPRGCVKNAGGRSSQRQTLSGTVWNGRCRMLSFYRRKNAPRRDNPPLRRHSRRMADWVLSFSRSVCLFPSCRPQDSLPIRVAASSAPWVPVVEAAHLDEVGSGAISDHNNTALPPLPSVWSKNCKPKRFAPGIKHLPGMGSGRPASGAITRETRTVISPRRSRQRQRISS